MENAVQDVLKKHPNAGRDQLIPILQEVQDILGFISRESVVQIGDYLKLPTSKIYGVATFYNQFRFEPKGRYHIQICRGTACHVKGSLAVLDALKRALKIDADQTTRDGMFSLEEVACLGACGLAPVIAVNGTFHAKVSADDVSRLVNTWRKTAESETSNQEAGNNG
jgi:NADH-quinone oxidoreductase subunit E